MSSLASMPAPRWSVVAPVAQRSRGNARAAWSTLNVSETGMFVAGEPLLEPGEEVDIDVALPRGKGGPHSFASKAKVIWVRPPAEANRARPSGMGMRFVGLEEPALRELRTYLEELAARQPWKLPTENVAESGGAKKGKSNDGLVEIQLVDVVRGSTQPIAPRVSNGSTGQPWIANRSAEVGARLGNYELLRRLGAGGMGDVFLAEHVLLGRRVALKLLHPRHAADGAELRRFFDEARLVNQIQHDNIVQITDLVVHEPHVFIVMELLEGETLADALSGLRVLSVERTCAIAVQLCGALDAVHRAGIVHRDIKPENIMLVQRGERDDFVKLLDFGIAKLRGATEMRGTQPGQVVGTLGFMAPEQLLGRPIDQRADLYALGVVLFVMLTGAMPFQWTSWPDLMMKQVNEDAPLIGATGSTSVPESLVQLVARCLSRDPAARPASAGELVAALRAHL